MIDSDRVARRERELDRLVEEAFGRRMRRSFVHGCTKAPSMSGACLVMSSETRRVVRMGRLSLMGGASFWKCGWGKE